MGWARTRSVALRTTACVLTLVALLAGLAFAKPAQKIANSGHNQSQSSHGTPAPPAPQSQSHTQPTHAAAPAQTTPATSTPTTTTPAPATPKPKRVSRKPKQRVLSGLLGGGTLFPARALILSLPGSSHLDPSALHVTENGVPVNDLSLKTLANAGPGDFGVVVVIDQSMSMSGAPLGEAMDAARQLASQRSGSQQLGLVTFDQTASTVLPLTSNPKAIQLALASTPWVAPGAKALPALSLAYRMLRQAKITAGAVILLADGADLSGGNPDAVTDTGQAAGVQTFTVAIHDQAYGQAAHSALWSLDTPFAQASGTGVSRAVGDISNLLNGEYLVRYRSHAPHRTQVMLAAAVDHVPGAVTASYLSPSPPPPPPPPKPHPAAPHPAPAPVVTLPHLTRHHSFWDSTLATVLVAAACMLLIGAGLAVVLSQWGARGRVQRRVATFIPDAAQPAPALDAAVEEQRAPGLLTRQDWWPAFVQEVGVARLDATPSELVRRAIWVSAAAAVALMLLINSMLLAILGLITGPLVVRLYVSFAAKRQRRRFEEQLPSHLQDLAGAMRAGRSIVGAITAVAQSADEPIKGELERAVADERLGKPLEEALQEIGHRMHAEDMEQFALIAALHRRSGSNVAESLDRVAEGARERADLKRELRALTSQAKISSRVLTALPPVMLVAIEILDPTYAKPLVGTAAGWMVLGFGAFLLLMGWLVMRRIVNVEA